MIEDLIRDLKREEGFRPYAYDDANGEPIVPGYTVVGHVTIWYGLCIEKGRVPPVPERIPAELLAHVAERKWSELMDRIPWVADLPADVQRALAQMAYQLGVDGVIRFRKMLAALERGDRATAAAEALDSDWAQQTPARAERVAALIRG